MTPFERVLQNHTFPFQLRSYQVEGVNELADLPRSGCYDEVGLGKTALATAVALYQKIVNKSVTVVILPPVLLRQWERWLGCVGGAGRVVRYQGTPAKRKEMSFENADWVLVSLVIFKNDIERFNREFEHAAVMVIVDEATCLKSVSSQNYRTIRDFSAGRGLLLLTATPLSTPIDAFAYCKLLAPKLYRSLGQFESLHVAERDFFGNVKAWSNLELLADNMKVNSIRRLAQDVLVHLGSPIYTPMFYDLAPEHLALYTQLAEDQILLLEDGGKIDATQENRLYHMLQQIICNPGFFAGDDQYKPAIFDLIDEVVAELDAGNPRSPNKLVIYANYRMTNKALLQYLAPLGAVALYSDISDAQKQRNLERFKTDPTCRVFVAQWDSGGVGVDGLQHVCSDALFVECPSVPRQFVQAVGRLFREGQRRPPTIRIAVAEGTLQNRKHRQLLAADQLVNRVQGGFKDLREAIYGGA